MALLLIATTTNPARADCPAAPISDPDDMAISFLAANGVQAASASMLASTVAEGTLVYDDTADKLKVCDGTNWIEVGSGSGTDTLASLSCTSGQIAKYNGTAWACATDGGGGSAQGPSFFAYKNADQTVTASTLVPLTWNAERFDTNNNFDLGTGRFTPTVPGKYIVTLSADCGLVAGGGVCQVQIYKNGSPYAGMQGGVGGTYIGAIATGIIDMNGTTDYVEARVYNTNTTIRGIANHSHFSGALLGGGSDTLSGLSCSTNEIPKWNGTAWACAADGGGGGGDPASYLVKGMSANQSSLASGTVIAFTTQVSSAGSKITHSGNRITVAGGSRYMLRAFIRQGTAGSALDYRIFDVTNGANVPSAVASANANSNFSDTDATAFVAPSASTTYEVRVAGGGGSALSGYSYFSAVELGGSSDTLASLSCSPNEIPKWNGTAWACATDGGAASPLSGRTLATQCSYTWSANATGWRDRTWVAGDCTNGLPESGDVATGWARNGNGTAGMVSCSVSTGSHYNHPTFGATSGTVICSYFREDAGGGGSDTLAGLACSTNEIPKWNGSAWVCAADGGGAGGGPAIAVGFPDAILCGDGSTFRVLHLEVAPNSSSQYVYRARDNNFTTNYQVYFASDGSYANQNNLGGYDCINKSISALYSEGTAFDFGGSSGGSGGSGDTGTEGFEIITASVVASTLPNSGSYVQGYGPVTNCPAGSTILTTAAASTKHDWTNYGYNACAIDGNGIKAYFLGTSNPNYGTVCTGICVKDDFGGGGADTLAGLSCATNEIPKWNGSAWACAADGSDGGASMTGAVMAFNASTCPDGWTEYVEARGRFLRGIDNGAGNDPDGTRVPGAGQDDALQNITGTLNVPRARVLGATSSGAFDHTSSGSLGATGDTQAGLGVTFDASRVARTSTETRPKNVAVIFCQYNGTGGLGGGGSGTAFGAWGDGGPYAVNTSYQAATDGIVMARLSAGSGDRCYIIGKSDSNATPTAVRGTAMVQETGSNDRIMMSSATFAVKKDDYWRVDLTDEVSSCAGQVGIEWIPLFGGGSGSATAAGDEGQLQFNDGSDGFAADGALHWDNTNKRFGIGTDTPTQKLDVAGTINATNLQIAGEPYAMTFAVRSSDATRKCISANYAPPGYSDDECTWIATGSHYYDSATSDTFPTYSNSTCTTTYDAHGLKRIQYSDTQNQSVYFKLAVNSGFYDTLVCIKGSSTQSLGY